MGERGPPKRPAAEHKRRGTYRGDRHAAPELPVATPAIPGGMPKAARDAWKRITPKLEAARLIADVDAEALRQLCEAVADYERAEKAIKDHGLLVSHTNTMGDDVLKLNPAWASKRDARTAIVSLLKQFGMTPSGRTGLGGKDDGGLSPELARILGISPN